MPETYSTEGPICPHCKRQFTADEPHYYDETGYTEDECDNCGKKFSVRVYVSTSWTCEAVNQ
jgi:DNA-directed RNA polymerase subunit RPC12/RpoP